MSTSTTVAAAASSALPGPCRFFFSGTSRSWAAGLVAMIAASSRSASSASTRSWGSFWSSPFRTGCMAGGILR
ncbi:hypothetical protein ACFQ0B_27180 [Nonomuraea thailandensis]